MLRRLFLAFTLSVGFGVLLPQPAHAGSVWSEVTFQISSGTTLVRLVARSNEDGTLTAMRYQHKDGDAPWSMSHTEGAGVTRAAYQALRIDAAGSQAAFDANATSALGSWYSGKGATVQAQFRDVTRRAGSVGFSVRLSTAGQADIATLADLTAMQDALLISDRAAFDDAAAIAWGTWYTGLSEDDADIIHGVIIDLTGAG